MQHAISRLVAWRDRELGRYPRPVTGGRQRLARAIAEQSAEAQRGPLWKSLRVLAPILASSTMPLRQAGAILFAAFERNRARYLSATVGLVMVIVMLVVSVLSPPVITATVFLDRARRSRIQETSQGHKAIYQRIQIRAGSRAVQREIVIGDTRFARSLMTLEMRREIDTWMPTSLTNSPLNWQDPLGVDAFQRWHDNLLAKQDEVTGSPKSLTLITRPEADPADERQIESASLTVRRSDWHPLAKRLQFRHHPAVEVTELSYEIRESMPLAASMAPPRPPKPLLSRTPHALPARPTEAQLDEAELKARLVLARLNGDR
jgi:hypothetical protein